MSVARAVSRWDQWQPSSLVKINLTIAAFILVAHIGGALVFVSQSEDPRPALLSLLGLDDLVAAVIAVTGLAALFRENWRWPVVRVHMVVLLVLATTWLYWGLSLAFGGLPDGNFAWNPLLFAFLCAYPIYLLRRTYLAKMVAKSWLVNYSHLLTAALSLLISAVIIYRLMKGNV